jgi:hypothetical protein
MKNKNQIVIIGLITFLIVASIVFILFIVNATPQSAVVDQTATIEVKNPKTGETFTFGRDGFITFKDKNGNLTTQNWDSGKIQSFFEYMQKNMGSTSGDLIVTMKSEGQITSWSLSGDDELIQAVIGDRGNNGGGTISNLFNTPTPYPTPSIAGGPTPPPVPSWCMHWKLSFCADIPISGTTAPTPTATAVPTSNGVIEANDCSEWNQKSGETTSISDSSCSKVTPTPNPNPYGY